MSDDRAEISHVYAGNPLDRGDRERRDEQWLADRARHSTSKFLPMWDLNVPITDGAEGGLGWLSFEDLTRMGVDAVPLFLGISRQAAHFVVDISKYEDAVRELQEKGDWVYQDARTATEFLSGAESGIVAQARAQVNWHNRNGFCSICGHETIMLRGGQVRQCSHCETQNYPRTDPVVITVVSDGDRCLLGRQAAWPEGMYSALAGFVEPGESLEEAVAREVKEEVGLEVGEVAYHSSQPWPFPASLMLGFHAACDHAPLRVNEQELGGAQWFSRAQIEASPEDDSFRLPRRDSIARRLIEDWLAED